MNKNKTDVLIIGAGIIGCSIAYELAKKKVNVTVIDMAANVGTESSWAGAGILTSHATTNEPYPELCRASLNLYPNLAEELRVETNIDIEFIRSGTLSVFFDEREAAGLIGLAERRVNRGFTAEILTENKVWELEPFVSKDITGGVLFPEDGHVRNTKIVKALAIGASNHGTEFLLGNPVSNFIIENGRVIGVNVNGETIHAETFVIAAGCWSGKIASDLDFHISILPAKGQIVLIESVPPIIRRTIDGLGIYIVPRVDGKILLGATVEMVGYDKTPTVDGVKQMIDAAILIAPELTECKFEQTWVGLRPYHKNGPCLGYIPGYDNVVIASGHYKNGILLAPITGKLISELITVGKTSHSLSPFEPREI